jgi:uncharacterized cupredoxin-like copper-binding protein
MTRKMTRRSFAALAVGVPGLAALYACTPGEPAPPSPTANVAFTQRQTGGAQPTATTAPAGGASATAFNVSMVDLKFEPADFTIPASTDVQVTAVNNGALEHNWYVIGTDFRTPIKGAGSSETVTVNLPVGTYKVECEVPGHAAAGMVGVLTVAAGGGAAPAAAAAPTSFDVSEVDLKFEPADFTIPADTDVTVNVTNNGALDHNWYVIGTDFRTKIAGAGDKQSITVNLPQGTYQVECEVPGHAAAGMVGVLTVAPAGAAPAGGTPVGGTPESGAAAVGATPEGATPVAATGGTPAAAAAAGSTAVTVSMVDLKFLPPDFTIPANTDVSVTATNDGFAEHNWDVLGTNFKTQIAGHGVSETITVNLPAGTYNVQCDVPGHAQAGMVGVLTVA